MSSVARDSSGLRSRASRARIVPGAARLDGLAIGLLGGSFNPAHKGHLHISRMFLKRLGLDRVWWLVSPQNPLKPTADMAAFQTRLEKARKIARANPRIEISDIEARLGAVYTVEMLESLTRALPRVRFVWLMGADNLCQIDRWRRWEDIFRCVPVAIYDRPAYSCPAAASKAARRFAAFQAKEREAKSLASRRPPAWIFLRGALDPTSATALRGKKA